MNTIEQLKLCGIDPQSYFLLKNNQKPVIRIVINENIRNDLQNFSKGSGIFVLMKKFKKIFYGNMLETPIVCAYFSLSKELAQKAYKAEKNEDRLKFGKLLGYPDCCIKDFIKNLDKEKDYTILSYKNTKGKTSFFCNNIFNFDSKLDSKNTLKIFEDNYKLFNKFNNLFLIRHVPCSFDCKESIKIGKKTLEILKKEMPEFTEKIVNAIKRPILYFDYFNWIVFDGEVNGNELKYNQVLPHESLFQKHKIKKIKEGNKLVVSDNKIDIFKNNKILFEIKKEDKFKGIIFDFN